MPNPSVFDEIKSTIEDLNWGSVEVIVQNGVVTQISTRIIKKTSNKSASSPHKSKKADKTGINLNFKY